MRRGVRLLAVLLVVVGAAPLATAETRALRFSTFLHAGPDYAAKVTDEIQTAESVAVVGCRNGWCEVQYGGGAGWLPERALTAVPAATPQGAPQDCPAFARSGWPKSGDPEHLCLYPAR